MRDLSWYFCIRRMSHWFYRKITNLLDMYFERKHKLKKWLHWISLTSIYIIEMLERITNLHIHILLLGDHNSRYLNYSFDKANTNAKKNSRSLQLHVGKGTITIHRQSKTLASHLVLPLEPGGAMTWSWMFGGYKIVQWKFQICRLMVSQDVSKYRFIEVNINGVSWCSLSSWNMDSCILSNIPTTTSSPYHSPKIFKIDWWSKLSFVAAWIPF
jgi:hypothetical protein